MSEARRIPTWMVHIGRLRSVYYTWYHADQFKRGLTRDGTVCHVMEGYEWVYS